MGEKVLMKQRRRRRKICGSGRRRLSVGGFHLSQTLNRKEPRRRGGRGTRWIKEQGMRSGWEDEGFFADILLLGIFTWTTNVKPLKSDAFIFWDLGRFSCIVNKHNTQSHNKCPLLLSLSRRHSSASATVLGRADQREAEKGADSDMIPYNNRRCQRTSFALRMAI